MAITGTTEKPETMSESPDPQAAEPVVEPVEAPAAEAPEAAAAAEVAEPAAEAAAEPPEGAEPTAEEPKKPKSGMELLRGRVSHLTKSLSDQGAELQTERSQREALQRLLESQGRTPEGDEPPARRAETGPAPGTPEFDRLVDERASQKAAQTRFTSDCNAIFDQGVEKHGETFREAVANLNALGMMNEQVIDAALATGAAPDVLNFLGSDVDEAARITALPPVRMAVELTRLASKLSQAKPEGPQISRAPAPITPVGGQSTTVEADIYDKRLNSGNSVSPEYAARRAAMGAPWAKPPKAAFGS